MTENKQYEVILDRAYQQHFNYAGDQRNLEQAIKNSLQDKQKVNPSLSTLDNLYKQIYQIYNFLQNLLSRKKALDANVLLYPKSSETIKIEDLQSSDYKQAIQISVKTFEAEQQTSKDLERATQASMNNFKAEQQISKDFVRATQASMNNFKAEQQTSKDLERATQASMKTLEAEQQISKDFVRATQASMNNFKAEQQTSKDLERATQASMNNFKAEQQTSKDLERATQASMKTLEAEQRKNRLDFNFIDRIKMSSVAIQLSVSVKLKPITENQLTQLKVEIDQDMLDKKLLPLVAQNFPLNQGYAICQNVLDIYSPLNDNFQELFKDNNITRIAGILNNIEFGGENGHYVSFVFDKTTGIVEIINNTSHAGSDLNPTWLDTAREIFNANGITELEYNPEEFGRDENLIKQNIDLHCGAVATFNALAALDVSKEKFLSIDLIKSIIKSSQNNQSIRELKNSMQNQDDHQDDYRKLAAELQNSGVDVDESFFNNEHVVPYSDREQDILVCLRLLAADLVEINKSHGIQLPSR